VPFGQPCLLCRAIGTPLAPGLLLAGHRRQPTPATFSRTHEAIKRAARLGIAAARPAGLGSCPVGRRAGDNGVRQHRQRAIGVGDLPLDFTEIGPDLLDRSDCGGELCLGGQAAARRLGLGLARPHQPLFGGSPLPGGSALSGGGLAPGAAVRRLSAGQLRLSLASAISVANCASRFR
jgi:hypothetical protein